MKATTPRFWTTAVVQNASRDNYRSWINSKLIFFLREIIYTHYCFHFILTSAPFSSVCSELLWKHTCFLYGLWTTYFMGAPNVWEEIRNPVWEIKTQCSQSWGMRHGLQEHIVPERRSHLKNIAHEDVHDMNVYLWCGSEMWTLRLYLHPLAGFHLLLLSAARRKYCKFFFIIFNRLSAILRMVVHSVTNGGMCEPMCVCVYMYI